MTPEDAAEKIARLRSVPLFADLSDGALQLVLDKATEFECPAGQVLVAPGQAGSGLFVIEEGTVVVELRDRKVELSEGQFFGELALLVEDATHSARVRTTTPVRAVAIARADFDRLLDSEPQMAMAMLKALARRLADDATSR
jgi:CRP-like cAMP-binding protein